MTVLEILREKLIGTFYSSGEIDHNNKPIEGIVIEVYYSEAETTCDMNGNSYYETLPGYWVSFDNYMSCGIDLE